MMAMCNGDLSRMGHLFGRMVVCTRGADVTVVCGSESAHVPAVENPKA